MISPKPFFGFFHKNHYKKPAKFSNLDLYHQYPVGIFFYLQKEVFLQLLAALFESSHYFHPMTRVL